MVTWASGLVLSGVLLSDPDMSLVDMRLGTVSEETVCSDGSEPLGVGDSEPLGFFFGEDPANIDAYVAPPLGAPSCWLQTAVCYLVLSAAVAVRSAEPAHETY